MILIDTSIVIDYARGNSPLVNAILPTVGAAVCGVVRAELLCGARDPKHRAALYSILAAFQQVPIRESLWDAVGDNLAALRRHGITVPFPDIVIATLGIDLNVEIWSSDPHYLTMQSHLPRLLLYQPPP